MIYLLHSTVTLGTEGRNAAQHYLGYCEDDALMERLRRHNSGAAECAITRAFVEKGGKLLLGAVWPGRTRDDERRMKQNGHLDRSCTICHPHARDGERVR